MKVKDITFQALKVEVPICDVIKRKFKLSTFISPNELNESLLLRRVDKVDEVLVLFLRICFIYC